MELISHIIAAFDDEAAALGEAESPLDFWSGFTLPGLNMPMLATLDSLLTGETLSSVLERYEPANLLGRPNDITVLRLGSELTTQLETLSEKEESALASIAYELSASDEFEQKEWDAEQALDLLNALANLAQLAESQGQALFVWMLWLNQDEQETEE